MVSGKAAARSTARRVMSAIFVDAGETVSRPCPTGQDEPWNDARTSHTNGAPRSGSSTGQSSKAAAEKEPEAYPLGTLRILST